ncbi:MAG: hypothetical protein OXI58_00700 [Gemmatimonadota bacterium]|nr:hypothetical protein [Gemmatimonadota bacterium]
MFAPLSRLIAIVVLCGLLVQPVQAESVDSARVEGEYQAATQKKTGPKEITIYIGGEYKTVAAALLDAVDEETPITGISDFDSLSSTYGLIGISSGFYGYRFRLTFPPTADVASIAGAYWSLPYINSVESEPVVTLISKEVKNKKVDEDDMRITKKLGAGVLGGIGGAFVGTVTMVGLHQPREGDDGIGGAVAAMLGIWGGNLVGTAVGVSRVDPQDNFLITLTGSALLGWGVPVAIAFISGGENLIILSGLLGPIVGATIASEKWRKPLSARLHLKPEARRVSVGLVPNPKGGLSAVATLRF